MKKVKTFLLTFFFSSPILYYYFSTSAFGRGIEKATSLVVTNPEAVLQTSFISKIMSLFSTANIEHILAITGAFAALATLTANKTDNKICNTVLKVINYLGMNFGLSANKDDENVVK